MKLQLALHLKRSISVESYECQVHLPSFAAIKAYHLDFHTMYCLPKVLGYLTRVEMNMPTIRILKWPSIIVTDMIEVKKIPSA